MPKKTWTPEQVKSLYDLWGTMKDAEVAEALGKSVSAVRLKATAIKVREKKGKRAGTRNGSVTSPWSKDEEMILIKNVGHSSIFELLDLLPGRTRASVESRCRRLGFSPTQGTYTRCGIERATGYDWRQIKRARDGIGQTWKKYGLRKYIITEDQYDEIIEYLKNEPTKWSKQWNLDACVSCGISGVSPSERHSGDGRCKICVDGSALISVKDRGFVKIADMVGQGAFEVWSGVRWRATYAIYSGFQEVIKIITNNGNSLWLTPDHKVLTGTGFIHAKCLTSIDRLPVQTLELPIDLIGASTDVLIDRHNTKFIKVYDLINVGPERQFVANGISVSNCWDRRRYIRNITTLRILENKYQELNEETFNRIIKKK